MAYQGAPDANGNDSWFADDGSGPYASYADAAAAESSRPDTGTAAAAGPAPSAGSGQPAGYQGLDYWDAQGQSPFDANGNLLPGWARTGNGYEQKGGDVTGADPYRGPRSPDMGWWQGAPMFNAPGFTPPPAFAFNKPTPGNFVAPDAQSLFSDPGYQFREQQGAKALQQSAAGKGVLRSGGTLKDLVSYGQNMASQEYGNAFDRADRSFHNNWDAYGKEFDTAADTYRTNYGVSRDVFDRTYKGAQDMFAPQLLDWQTKMGAQKSAADQSFDRAWDEYIYGQDYKQHQRDSILNAGAA